MRKWCVKIWRNRSAMGWLTFKNVAKLNSKQMKPSALIVFGLVPVICIKSSIALLVFKSNSRKLLKYMLVETVWYWKVWNFSKRKIVRSYSWGKKEGRVEQFTVEVILLLRKQYKYISAPKAINEHNGTRTSPLFTLIWKMEWKMTAATNEVNLNRWQPWALESLKSRNKSLPG